MDMLDVLGDLTEADASRDKPIFVKDEIVEFLVKDFKLLADKGNALLITTKILTGPHQGRDYNLFIDQPDNDVRRKRRAAFFFQSGIWTKAELDAAKINPRDNGIKMARLVGMKLQGKAGTGKPGRNGQTFQDIDDIKSLGVADASTTAMMSSAPAAVAAGQTTF